MSVPAVLPTSYRTDDFLSPETLDRADTVVMEIFKVMLELDILPFDPNHPFPPLELDERTAIVGFSGAMRGSCQIRISAIAAKSIASAMLGGAPVDDNDDSIDDALGELCNMLAGGWKNRVASLSSECALSPPTVISGRSYKVHMSTTSAKLSRSYQFDAHALHLTLYRENVGPVGG